MADEIKSDITALTVQLVSAFVSNNTVASENLADLIKSTRLALTGDLTAPAAETATPEHVPAVSVRKSLSSREHILSLIDGKPYKTLKRHLAQHGLSPEQYRERYKLPKSYPLVAPSYSDARRAVAEKLGLGRKPAAAPVPAGKSDAKEMTATAKAAAVPAPAKVAKSKASSAPAAKAEVKPAAKAAPRKRLSIAAPKDEKPAPTPATNAPKSEVAQPDKSKAAAKAKPASRAKAAPKAKASKTGTTAAPAAAADAMAPESSAQTN